MTTSDWITVVGAGVTILSMVVSIRQARSAFRSSQAAKNAMAAVQLAAVAERLEYRNGAIDRRQAVTRRVFRDLHTPVND